MRDAVTDGEPGLGSFRRYPWWSLAGATTVFLVLIVGAIDTGLPVAWMIAGSAGSAVLGWNPADRAA